MANEDPWLLLRGARAQHELGLKLLGQVYAEQPNPSNAMELGVALLWVGNYGPAWEHFHERISRDQQIGDNEYGMAGVAKWCVGEPQAAIDQWRAGLKAKYARASGLGVRLPLLLLFAAVLRPELSDMNFAISLLQDKAKDRRIRNWPGPIAKLVLGQIDENEFQALCRGGTGRDTEDRQWLAQFYKSIIAFHRLKRSVFEASMRQLSDVSQPKWQDEQVFLSRVWNEEFFLARHESEFTSYPGHLRDAGNGPGN